MMTRKLTTALGAIALLALVGGQAQADKCTGTKLKATGKKESAKLKCYSKAAAKGIGVDGACLMKADDKFSVAFAKAVGCPGVEGTCESVADDCVTKVVAALPDAGASKCESSRLKAAGKKASGKLICYSKAATKSILVDNACLMKAEGKFNTAWSKTSGCSGDQTNVETLVDTECVSDVVADGTNTCVAPTTTTTTTSTTTTTCPAASCTCTSGTPSFLGFTTSVGAGTCGTIVKDDLSTVALDCNTLYIGGGGAGAVPPGQVPDYGTTKFGTCCSGTALTLHAASATDTGSNRDCSSAGCLYGAPLPIPNPSNAPLSTCVINEVATDAVGTATCDAGNADINIPLTSNVFLPGDILLKRCAGTTNPDDVGRNCDVVADCPGGTCQDDGAAIQPCPICNPTTGKCNGGSNDVAGMPAVSCTPGTLLASGDDFPTSHDCPVTTDPPFAKLAIPYVLTTGTSSKTAVDLTQLNVFCGFCGGALNNVFKKPPVLCTADAGCVGLTGCPGTTACNTCKQRNPGAFGVGAARTISETGTAAGPLSVGGPSEPATLASIFCIPPTYAAAGLVDANADLPGPGGASLNGSMQLIP